MHSTRVKILTDFLSRFLAFRLFIADFFLKDKRDVKIVMEWILESNTGTMEILYREMF